MSTALALRNVDAITVEISDDIRKQVSIVLAECQSVATVSDPLDFDAAIDAQRAASQLAKGIDAQRKDITRPLDDLKARAIELVRELTQPLEAEVARLSRLNAAYEAERRRKAEEEARKAREEQFRIEQEARKKREEEQRKIDEETRAKAAQASEAERAQIEAEAAKAREQADERARLQAEQARDTARLAQVQAEAAKPAGVTMRSEPRYEITDPKALYAVRPEWFELKPRDGLIKTALRQIDADAVIPGMRHWREEKISAR